jgi:exodeoxyribonuclease VII large subunit
VARRTPTGGSGQLSFTDAVRGLQSLHDDMGGGGPTEDPAEDPGDGPRPWTVSEACDRVNRALAEIESGREIQVEGEVGTCSIRDHWYFTLRDERGATLPCSYFSQRRRADRGAPTPALGMRVIATGRLEYWAKGGKTSLIVSRLREAGQGDLHQRFERLKADLEARGWFDPDRRLSLPTFATSALVLTSGDGAARRDIEETARQRWPGFRLHLVPIPVQGQAAIPRIADAVRRARRVAPMLGIDAIILTRGGGSLEDLWCFNEEAVAAAIIESRDSAIARHARGGPAPVPLVAAIGHETDVSIAEFCADLRASTPTQAAMVLVPDAGEHGDVLDARASRMRLLVERGHERAASRIAAAARHEILRRPDRLVDPHRRRLDDLADDLGRRISEIADRMTRRTDASAGRLAAMSPRHRLGEAIRATDVAANRLERAFARRLERWRDRLDAQDARLRGVGPDSVLERGFAIVLGEDGRAVRNANDLTAGDRITARLARGRVAATVTRTEPGDGGPTIESSGPSADAAADADTH